MGKAKLVHPPALFPGWQGAGMRLNGRVIRFAKIFPLVLVAGVLAGCASPMLDVRPMHLRNLDIAEPEQPMIRGEQRQLLYGAIGVREQEQRLGHYYVVLWNEDSPPEDPVRVVFEYQQAATASRVLRKEQSFPPYQASGRAEFRIIGDDYLKGGRVLAWRCRLFRGGGEVASRHSYLWD